MISKKLPSKCENLEIRKSVSSYGRSYRVQMGPGWREKNLQTLTN
jgi:hypothetical protein